MDSRLLHEPHDLGRAVPLETRLVAFAREWTHEGVYFLTPCALRVTPAAPDAPHETLAVVQTHGAPVAAQESVRDEIPFGADVGDG